MLARLTKTWLCALALLGANLLPAVADTGRIVAVGGSITEIIYALGEQDQLIARDTTSVFPEEATRLPDVGYIRALSPEGVLSINPGKVVALEGAGPPESLEVLKKSRVPIVMVPDEYSVDGIIRKIEVVGEAIGVPDKAEALAQQVAAAVADAEKQARSGSEKPSVLFVLSTSGGRIMAAGTGTSAAGIIEMAGGRNAIRGVEGYKQFSDEAIITAAPDIILTMDRGGGHSVTADSVATVPALAATPAGRAGRVVRMNGLYLLGFGPRTAEAIRELAAALHEPKG